jgi:hypothetical protein
VLGDEPFPERSQIAEHEPAREVVGSDDGKHLLDLARVDRGGSNVGEIEFRALVEGAEERMVACRSADESLTAPSARDLEIGRQPEQAPVGQHQAPEEAVIVRDVDVRAERWRDMRGDLTLELTPRLVAERQEQDALMGGKAARVLRSESSGQ